MASLLGTRSWRIRRTDNLSRYRSSETITFKRTVKGNSIDIAAGEIAELVVGIATERLHLNFKSLVGNLKAAISSEDSMQTYERTQVFKSQLKVAVIHLSKTLEKSNSIKNILRGSKYKMTLEGDVSVIEAQNERQFGELKLNGIEANATKVKTIKKWLALLPTSVTEKVQNWLVEYGIDDLDSGLDGIVAMKKEDLVQLMNVMSDSNDYLRRHAYAALKGLGGEVKWVVEEEVKRKSKENTLKISKMLWQKRKQEEARKRLEAEEYYRKQEEEEKKRKEAEEEEERKRKEEKLKKLNEEEERKRKEEEERKRKEEEEYYRKQEEKRKRIREEEEAKRRKEAEERKRKEAEEKERKRKEERERKRKEEEERKRKEVEERKRKEAEEERKRKKALLVKKISEVKEKYKGKDNPPFIHAASDGNIEDVRILLLEKNDIIKKWMDVNQKGRDGQTALHWASWNGHTHVVNLLLQQKNVNINLEANSGWTALDMASYKGYTEIVQSLKIHSS